MSNTINEALAKQAKEAMSFDSYKPGSATAAYNAACAEAREIAEAQKKRVDPMYHDKIDGLLASYCRRLAENINSRNRIGASCPSIMIAGGSNFPVRKKEKQNAAMDRNMQEYEEIEAILTRIKSVGMGGISSDDPNAIDKLTAKLDKLEKHQALMKAANAAIRMKDKEKGDAKLRELGYTDEEIKQLRTPDFCGRIGYPSYELSNNNARIKATRDRIDQLRAMEETPMEGWFFDGGEVVCNKEINRLQIIFDDIPSPEIRQTLKDWSFRWAPSEQAWQRQLNPHAIEIAKTRIPFLTPIPED